MIVPITINDADYANLRDLCQKSKEAWEKYVHHSNTETRQKYEETTVRRDAVASVILREQLKLV